MKQYSEEFDMLGGSRRRGFSFTEILFAVMILGIGFIMVAAVFPVAIKQTQETVDETTAADVAKGGASYLARIGTNANFPLTNGAVVAGPTVPAQVATSFWGAVNGNLILSTDSRYAWVPFYSRGAVYNPSTGTSTGQSDYAQVTIIAVQAKNTPNFTNSDLTLQTLANLEGRAATANFTSGSGTTPDTITLTGGATANISEGTYVVVADDGLGLTNPPASCDGYVYRVGIRSNGSLTTWELLPGSDMKNSRYKPGSGVHVFIVGRGYNNPGGSTPDTGIAGPAMDVAAYSTFIQIRPDPTH